MALEYTSSKNNNMKFVKKKYESLFDIGKANKKKYGTETNTWSDFAPGDTVRVIVPCQDFKFFDFDEGTVTRSSDQYLVIMVFFKNDDREFEHNFLPQDLLKLTTA